LHSPDCSSSESSAEEDDLTVEDLVKVIGNLPSKWPEDRGIKLVNNLRERFPDYPLEGIMMMLITHEFHGGETIHAIRETGPLEVEVNPPVLICAPMFPAEYKILRGEVVKIYEQGCAGWNFRNMRNDRLPEVGQLVGDDLFQVLEVRRGQDYGFCYGRVSTFRGRSPDSSIPAEEEGKVFWVVLGLENNRKSLLESDLNYTSAHRMF
jgi:hypothetical protein